MSEEEISKLFTTVTNKLFTDIIFANNRHLMIVKTWEQIKFIGPSLKGSEAEKMHFYIKTLQFYNSEGVPYDESAILVEQVFGAFDEFRLYDVSTIQNDNKVYYFKRVFTDQQPRDATFSEYGSEGYSSTILSKL